MVGNDPGAQNPPSKAPSGTRLRVNEIVWSHDLVVSATLRQTGPWSLRFGLSFENRVPGTQVALTHTLRIRGRV